MKLRRIEILGFKSFRTKVGVEIGDGVTAVVGPNGCGKSNIVDAIRWAMGSQSPRDLRGRAMEDIIFGGSENHKPMGFAEVSLSFDNDPDTSSLPLEWRDQASITVTRRLFRNGDSDYEINGARARLRDIHDVFAGTGVSSRDAYSIIEQGRIGFVVNALPAERRVMIEEAAGITRYKNQRKIAERRLEKTQDNLLRIGDVVREVQAQSHRLERQAQKAVSARRMHQRLREIHMVAHADVLRATDDNLRQRGESCRTAEQMSHDQQVQSAKIETHYEALRLQMEAAESHAKQASEAAYQIRAHVDLLEANIAHRQRERLLNARRREEADARNIEDKATRERLYLERQSLYDAEQKNEGNDDGLVQKLQQLSSENNMLRDQSIQASKEMNASRDALNEFERTLARSATRAEAQRSELKTLEARERDAESSRKALETDAQNLRAKVEALRERLQTEDTAYRDAQRQQEALKTWERDARQQLETMLHAEREQQNVVRKSDASVRSVEQIMASGAGLSAGAARVLASAKKQHMEGVCGPLAHRLRVQEGAEDPLAAIADEWMDALVVERDDVALKLLELAKKEKQSIKVLVLRRAYQGEIVPWLYATDDVPQVFVDLVRDGTVTDELNDDAVGITVDSRRFWTDGRGRYTYRAGNLAAEHLVTLGRELEQAQRTAQQAVEQAAIIHQKVQDAEQAAAAALASYREQQELCESKEQIVRQMRIELDDQLTRAQHAERQLRLLEVEHEETRHRSARIRQEIDEAAQTITEATAQRDQTQRQLEWLQNTNRQVQQKRRENEEQLTELKVLKAKRDAEASHAIEQKKRVARELEAVIARIQNTERALQESQEEDMRLQAQTVEDERALQAAKEKRLVRDQAADRAQAAFEELRVQTRELEINVSEQRKKTTASQQDLQRAQLELERARDDRQRAIQTCTEQFQCSPEALLQEVGTTPWTHELEGEQAEIERKLEALGPVNPAAEEEYEAAVERRQFLEEQKQDLEIAMADLSRALQKMDDTCRVLFNETFHKVNERFQEMFPRLFRGGSARLELTDPSDLLTTGVEIIAQPPGKRLQNLSLFSGGEKALTAAALIFAIFELRPSPICILDEVDAPLDEANVGRFADMVREISSRSQFLVITHNTRTMEAADTLYGVTMQEAGVSKLVGVDLKATRAPAPVDAGLS